MICKSHFLCWQRLTYCIKWSLTVSCCSRYDTQCYYARLAQSRWWLNSGLNGLWNGVKIPQLLVPIPTVCSSVLAILRAPLSLASNFHCTLPLQGLSADVPLNLELPDYLPAACAAVKRCSAAPGHFPLFITYAVTEAVNVLPTVQRGLVVPRWA